MNLGKSYTALNVTDIKKSFDFYSLLGYQVVENGGSLTEKWLILQNGSSKIGLYEGMIKENTTTYHSENVRAIYQKLRESKAEIVASSKNIGDDGPCYFMTKDPDGNRLLFDQID